MADGVSGVVAKDMATTPEEFLRLIPRLARGMTCVVQEGCVRIGESQKGVVITTRALAPRRIAGLALDRCRVELAFRGMHETEVAAFLTHFDRVYHRGGG